MNEPLVVVLQRRATREIEDIDAWWRQNRPASPDLFLAELESILAATALMPALGATRYEASEPRGCAACSFAGRSITSTTGSAVRRSRYSPFGTPRAERPPVCRPAVGKRGNG